MDNLSLSKKIVAEERKALMWQWQSPVIPAYNEPIHDPMPHCFRLKGPYKPSGAEITEKLHIVANNATARGSRSNDANLGRAGQRKQRICW